MRPDQQHLPVVDELRKHPTTRDKTYNSEFVQAIDAVAEYVAANDELIAARKALAAATKWGIEAASVAMDKAEKRHAAAHARMKGESK